MTRFLLDTVLAELWYGVENSSSRERNAERLRRVLPDLVIWPLTEPAAEEYGRIAAELRRAGRPLQLAWLKATSHACRRDLCRWNNPPTI